MPDVYCLECWCVLAPCLARAGSLFCHDHRGSRDVVAGGLPNTAPTPLIVEPPSLAARENAEVTA